jgi:hypothetical protein
MLTTTTLQFFPAGFFLLQHGDVCIFYVTCSVNPTSFITVQVHTERERPSHLELRSSRSSRLTCMFVMAGDVKVLRHS